MTAHHPAPRCSDMLPASLRTHPGLPGYEFSVIAGTVLSEAVIPSTRPGPPPGVNHTALHYREFWVRRGDRTEIRLYADADQLQLRESHRVTLIVAERADGARYVVRAWNHDAPHYSTLMEKVFPSLTHDFPGQTGCTGLPATALVGSQIVLALVGPLFGLAWGFLSAGIFFTAVIALWLKRGTRDRRHHDARKTALVEHLAAITRALSDPAPQDGGATPPGSPG